MWAHMGSMKCVEGIAIYMGPKGPHVFLIGPVYFRRKGEWRAGPRPGNRKKPMPSRAFGLRSERPSWSGSGVAGACALASFWVEEWQVSLPSPICGTEDSTIRFLKKRHEAHATFGGTQFGASLTKKMILRNTHHLRTLLLVFRAWRGRDGLLARPILVLAVLQLSFR